MTKLKTGDQVMIPSGEIARIEKIDNKFVHVKAEGYEDEEVYFKNELIPLSMTNKYIRQVSEILGNKKDKEKNR